MELSLERIDIYSEQKLQEVFNRSPRYFKYVEGVNNVPKEAARETIEAIPLNIPRSNKYVFLIKANQEYIGAVDLIDGYPENDTAFIGLLIIVENQQAKGMGMKVYDKLEGFIKEQLKSSKVMLAIVETNPVEGFWKKMGFEKIGQKKVYENGDFKSFSQRMVKFLN